MDMCPWILREALSQIRVSVTESGLSAAIGKKQIFRVALELVSCELCRIVILKTG